LATASLGAWAIQAGRATVFAGEDIAMRRLFVVTLACLALATTAVARDRWLRLGSRSLDPRGHRAEIHLRGGEWVEALVLGVENASIRIREVKVQLGNGRVLDWPIHGVLYPRERTRSFNLPGPFDRRVKKVVIYYETGRGHGRDRGRGRDRDRDRDDDWDRDWDRHYGRYKPVVTIWGRD